MNETLLSIGVGVLGPIIVLMIVLDLVVIIYVVDYLSKKIRKRKSRTSNVLFEDDQRIVTFVVDTDSKPWVLTEDCLGTKTLSPIIEVRNKHTDRTFQYYLERK